MLFSIYELKVVCTAALHSWYFNIIIVMQKKVF